MNIKEYIDSGILETYVLGAASESEVKEILRYKHDYPEVKKALEELELDLELMAETMAIVPPPGMWDRISDSVDGLIVTEPKALRMAPDDKEPFDFTAPLDEAKERYIEVETSNTYMRIHKAWRWVFAAVFVLGKIFLGFAIYYYLENRQMREQIQDLKAEVKQYKLK